MHLQRMYTMSEAQVQGALPLAVRPLSDSVFPVQRVLIVNPVTNVIPQCDTVVEVCPLLDVYSSSLLL